MFLSIQLISVANLRPKEKQNKNVAIYRSIQQISSEIINKAYDETVDVFDLLDNAETKLFDITQGN